MDLNFVKYIGRPCHMNLLAKTWRHAFTSRVKREKGGVFSLPSRYES